MASGARKVVIEFLGDDKSASKTARSVEGHTHKLGSTLGKVGLIAGAGLGAGIAAGALAMADMTRNAAADEAGQRRLATALKNSTGANKAQVAGVEDYISKAGVATGVTDDEMRPAFQQLVESTGSVKKAQDEMNIALDVSAGTGKSLKTVTSAMMKANNGTTASLSKLGLKTKDAHGKTLKLKDAMHAMAGTFKGQAQAKAESLEGKMDRLKLIFDETKETIGAKLIPIVSSLASFFIAKVVPAIATVSDWLGKHLVPMLGSVGNWIRDHVLPMFHKFGGEGPGAFDKLKAAIAPVIKAFQGFVSGLRPIIVAVVNLIRSHWSGIIAVVKDVFGTVWIVIKTALQLIGAVVKLQTLIISFIWKHWSHEILTVVKTVFRFIRDIITNALKIIRGVMKVITSVIHGDWKGAWQGIKLIFAGVWGAIKAILRAAWDVIRGVFHVGFAAIKGISRAAWDGIKGLFRAAWDGLKNIVGNGVDAVVRGVKSLPGKVRALGGAMRDAGAHIIGQMVDGLRNAGGVVSGIAGNVWSAVKGLLNSAIGRINSALSFSINLPGPDIHVSSHIPYLAKGGVVTRPTLAMIGEAGPEAVVPLGRAGVGGNTYIVVNGALDPSAVAKQIHTLLLSRARQTGQGLGLG